MDVNVALCVLCAYCACAMPNPGPSAELLIDRYSLPSRCGREVQPGDYVRYHYTGSFPDGRIFDSRALMRNITSCTESPPIEENIIQRQTRTKWEDPRREEEQEQ